MDELAYRWAFQRTSIHERVKAMAVLSLFIERL